MAVQWVRRLVTIFLRYRQVFNPRPTHVEFEVKRDSWNNPNETWELKFQMKIRVKGV
jgi:hypothetical protein